LKQRNARYGFGLHFAVGVAASTIIGAWIVSGFSGSLHFALGTALVATIFLHARMGLAFSRSQAEIELLKRLQMRAADIPLSPSTEALEVAPQGEVTLSDVATLSKIRTAIENGHIDLYLQPIVSLPQRKIRYYEAFSRMRDQNGSVLRPAEYIEAAERADKIGLIDNMIIVRCVQSLRQLVQRDPQLRVFCNLSPATIYDVEFFDRLADYLEISPSLASHVVFEFTLPAVQSMHPRVEASLQSLTSRGFVFSIDHVHSLDLDFASLRERGFRYVKAPASLLLAAGLGDQVSQERLRKFRAQLSELGVDLIAEKVELESHMPEILALGIDFGQGNLFGAALPADAYVRNDRQIESAAA
jgi:cyclic-di-GMP phosphodiesterase TipF (flagellum assembly factor)